MLQGVEVRVLSWANLFPLEILLLFCEMKHGHIQSNHLPYPYRWNDRFPLMKDGVFYVPEYYESHRAEYFPTLQEHFGNHYPVHIEYCSGNGEWILEQACKEGKINWIAVEKWFPRVRKLYAKRMRDQLDNVLIVSGEGLTFSREYLPDASLDEVFVNFPDPWPKKRHAKHRIVQPPFAEQLRRTLKKGGKVTFVTDHLGYKKQMEEVMEGWRRINRSFEGYGSSFFERLWRSHGLEIHRLCYVND